MTDFASLGIELDSRPLNDGAKAMDALGEASVRVEQKVRVTNGQMNDTAKIMEAQRQKMAEAASSANGMSKAMSVLTDGQAHFIDKLKEQATTVGMSRAQLLAYEAAELGVTEQTKEMIAAIEAASKAEATHVVGMSSSLAKMEAMRVIHDAMIGSYTRMGSSLFVLGNATGLTTSLFTAEGAVLLGLIGAVGALGYSLYKSAQEQDAFNNSMILTNGYAGLTRDSMNSLAKSIESASTGGFSKASEMLAGLAATGRFSGETLASVGQEALKFGKLTGQSSDDVIKYFGGMEKGVAEWAYGANESYHFMNAAQYEQIVMLEKQGESAKAMIQTMHMMDDAMDVSGQHMGYWAKNAAGWREMLDGLSESMRKLVFPTLDESATKEFAKMAELKSKLADTIANGSGPDSARADALRSQIAEESKVLHDAIAAANDATIAAAKKQVLDEANLRGVAAQKQFDQIKQGNLERDELRDQELAAVRRTYADMAAAAKVGGTAMTVTLADELEQEARIRARYAEKAPAGSDATKVTLDGELKAIQESVAAAKSHYDQLDKLAEIYHKGGIFSDGEFNAAIRANADALHASQVAGFDKQIADLQSFHGKTNVEEQAAQNKLEAVIAAKSKANQDYADKLEIEKANELAEQKKVQDVSDDATNKYISGLNAQAQAIEIANGKHQRSASVVAEEAAAQTRLAVSLMAVQAAGPTEDGHTQADADAAKSMLVTLQQEADAQERIAAALKAGEAAAASRKLAEQSVKDWREVGATISDSLTKAFGAAGKAAGDMFKIYSDNVSKQKQLTIDLADLKAKGADTPASIQRISDIQRQAAEAQIKSYADMAGAAQSYFSEGSRGYQAMGAVSKIMHVEELAMNAKSIISGVAAGAAQMFGQSGWGGFAGVAAMGAVMAGLGVAIGSAGNGGGQSAADVQKIQGTGTVFGDTSAKSDSLNKAIELMSANSSIELTHTAGMLASLRNIESAMTGLGNLIVRADGVSDASNLGIFEGTAQHIGNTSGANLSAKGAIFNGGTLIDNGNNPLANLVLGGGINNIIDRVTSLLGGKTTTNITDSGIQYGGNIGELEAGRGYQQYANVTSNSSSLFGLVKSTSNSVQTGALNEELSSQFGKIFSNLEDSLKAAAAGIGVGTDQVTHALDNLVIDTTKVSLKGLSGDALTSALNAVVSKTMDQMAAAALPAFDQFQQVGEGYAQTVMRVAADYANLNSILESTGMQFGAVGMDSLAAREKLISMAGGIDKLATESQSFGQNYLTQAERLAPVQKYVTDQLTALGLAGITTRDQFKQTVLGLDLTTDAGQKEYVGLMALSDAFAQTHAATVDLTKSQQEIADERKDLQTQLDQLTMTSAQLLQKQRGALDASNQALFDQIQMLSAQQAQQKEQHGLDIQLMTSMGNAEGALAAQRSDALAALLSDSARVTQQKIWAADDANAAIEKAKQSSAAALSAVDSARSALTSAYQSESGSLQSLIAAKLAEADATRKQIDALKLGAQSSLSPEAKYAEAQRQFAAATGQDKIAAGTALLDASKAYNASSAAYASDFQKVQNAMEDAAAASDNQADFARQQLVALNESVSGLTTVNSSVLSVRDAVIALNAAKAAAGGAGGAAGGAGGAGAWNGEGIMYSDGTIWDSVTGVHAAGSYTTAMAGNATSASAAGISNVDPWVHSHDSGLDSVPFDGYPAKLHFKEQVRTRAQVDADASTSKEVSALLRQMLNELQADKVQRGAVGTATLKSLDKVVDKLDGSKRVAARA